MSYELIVGLAMFSCPLIWTKIVHVRKKHYDLLNAAVDGDLDACMSLITRGVDLNRYHTEDGFRPLQLSSRNGHLAVVQCLLENGADVNQTDNRGVSSLWIASYFGHLDVIQCLVNHGADKDKCSMSGCSPLYIAADVGHLPVVKYLLEQGADKDKAAIYGTSPLYVAILRAHLHVVQCLVDHGVNVNNATSETWGLITPLHCSVREDQLDIAIYLMQYGLANLHARTSEGQLPIDMARNDVMRQAIRDEEIRRKDNHGFKRSPVQGIIIPMTSTSEEENDGDDNNDNDSDASSESSEDEYE